MSEYLVSGGAGFVGSHLTDRLIDEGHTVTVLDNLSRGENINPKAIFLDQDLESRGVLNWATLNGAVKRSQAVFHLAALARVRPSIENPYPYHEANVNATLNLLEVCRKYGRKIIFASSSSVFGNAEPPFSESTPKSPLNPYALQKLIGEQYMKLYGQLYDLDYSIVRYFNVYGERQLTEGAYACVMGIFQRQKEAGEPMTIFGDGEQRRDFTYVADAVDATIRCLQPQARQQTYNIGRGDNRSVNQIADLIGKDRVHLPEVPGEMRETLCENRKARVMLGWEPKVDVEDWLK